MEDYLEVVLALIARSGACLVDVTGWNPNVLYEMGVAQGRSKKLIVLAAEPVTRLPANVTQHTAFRLHYDPRLKGWPEKEINRFALQMHFVEFALTE